MTDIVERLRMQGIPPISTAAAVMNEAAAEIERLRGLIADLFNGSYGVDEAVAKRVREALGDE